MRTGLSHSYRSRHKGMRFLALSAGVPGVLETDYVAFSGWQFLVACRDVRGRDRGSIVSWQLPAGVVSVALMIFWSLAFARHRTESEEAEFPARPTGRPTPRVGLDDVD